MKGRDNMEITNETIKRAANLNVQIVNPGDAEDDEGQIPIGCVLVLEGCGGNCCVATDEAVNARLDSIQARTL